MRTAAHLALLFGALIFVGGCDTYCIDKTDVLWEPGLTEFRLELTNRSGSMIELRVDGESVGVFCDGVDQLPVGNFAQSECSQIQAFLLDNPDRIDLDDCTTAPPGPCEGNNTEGRVCYDTFLIDTVEAVLE